MRCHGIINKSYTERLIICIFVLWMSVSRVMCMRCLTMWQTNSYFPPCFTLILPCVYHKMTHGVSYKNKCCNHDTSNKQNPLFLIVPHIKIHHWLNKDYKVSCNHIWKGINKVPQAHLSFDWTRDFVQCCVCIKYFLPKKMFASNTL